MSLEISIEQGDWASLRNTATAIRRQVFIVEQGVSQKEEWDGRDPECLHFIAREHGRALGTARLLPDGHIGRVAVLSEARGRGIGVALMQAAIQAAHVLGHVQVELSAQTHALAFYERLGFKAFDDAFLDAGIPHRYMSLRLSD
ncbi:GNAT family N-acetyltransferase [Pistricoccus aurantiacus]|uniref:GNAT family N-acetyltransferase n=1 Tax=Pistricoccus aurantiacus TaxID=1883414 RepID=A0A5B8SQL4_9GAMM|nr:GNAT family N-acetyltransferase [Pistricoccus aurantiacus]QEA39429.1 GNAT family N-acetyltransferase [Pistricoccus aurantiacus]